MINIINNVSLCFLSYRDKGIIVVLTVTPFVSTSSPNFEDGVEQGHFISELTRVDDSAAHENGHIDNKRRHKTIPPALTSYKVNITITSFFDIVRSYSESKIISQ